MDVISFAPIRAEEAREYRSSLRPDVRYVLDHHPSNLSIVSLRVGASPAGFCAMSGDDSFFHPGASILQLSVVDEQLRDSATILKALAADFGLKKGIASTEDPAEFSAYLDLRAPFALVALGFAEGGPPPPPPIREGSAIRKAGPEDREAAESVWPSIYSRLGIDPSGCAEEMERTRRQLDAGDLFLLEEGGETIGFGNANFAYASGGEVEIGYAVKPDRQGEGFATLIAVFLRGECARRGFRAVAHCGYPHPASERVLVKAGMRSIHRVAEFDLR